MTTKYQVFLSSTYEDLKSERAEVIRATLEMGHIPVGMEMFSAADDEQWKIITRTIDQSDYYIVIVGHRYGSLVEGISYTEKEYDYAVEQGIPVLGFVIDDAAPWPRDRMETEAGAVAALTSFKSKVRRKPVAFWTSADDLHSKVAVSLMKAIVANPRPGWIRSTEGVPPSVMTELSRLSSENADLRRQLGRMHADAKDEEKAIENQLVQTLSNNNRRVAIKKAGQTTWTEIKHVSLLSIFAILAPELMIEKSVDSASRMLSISLVSKEELAGALPATSYPIASNTLKNWLADLAALELVEPSKRKHVVSDNNEYWTLTTYGRHVYIRLRRLALEAGVPLATPRPEPSDSGANDEVNVGE
jgi:hypothetical protein